MYFCRGSLEDLEEINEIEHICFPENEACSREHFVKRLTVAPEHFLLIKERTAAGQERIVGFVNDIATLDIARYGSILERHAAFPSRCNIEFAQPMADGTLRTRVWERGSGITMACGTGACATAVAAALTGRSGRSSRIAMDGGTLDITWQEADNHVMMAGPAEFVFEGEINLDN